MNSEFIGALNELEKEKGISKEVLLDAIETALISSYKRNFGITQNARVSIDADTGEVKVFAEKTVVDDVFDDSFEISLEDAREINPAYEEGDTVEIEVTPASFGRIAAQTAKQVIVQRIREAERGVIYDQFSEKENEIMTAVIHRIERGCIYLELGRAEGILPMSEAIPSEHYQVNQRLKVYVIEVRNTAKGAQIVTSRTHPGLVRRLFELEVPEINENVVQIKSIAREAGNRSKNRGLFRRRECRPGRRMRRPERQPDRARCFRVIRGKDRRDYLEPGSGRIYRKRASPCKGHHGAGQCRRKGRQSDCPGLPAFSGDRQRGTKRTACRETDRI